MQASTPDPTTPVDDNTAYTAEIRFGVVMYGGVSLAVYINGVTNELYEMACATPRRPIGPAADGSTRELYARLSWLTSNPALRAAYAAKLAERGAQRADDPWPGLSLAGAERSRLVVDVISGTSAGGINGVFLAKALANGEEFGALEGLWLAEGDIGRLLNDAESYDGLDARAPRQDAHPKSLLNSDRMYLKLLDALREMKALPMAGVDAESPLVEQMDLYVTTTDVAGAPVALRLFDKVVYERRYKQRFHFQYPNGVADSVDRALPRNDFDADRVPFLAFAARCTSSFPFAFEPMTLARLTELHGDAVVAPDALRRWDPYFDALPRAEVDAGAHVWRAFGDGGYLDNKPFSYVVDTLAQRQASVPVERKVVYVEPSPDRIDPHERPGPTTAPDALSNAFAALTTIPSYEGIREDLQAILQRNRRIERVEKIVRLGEADLEADDDPFNGVMDHNGAIPQWTSLSFKDTVRYYGLAFMPYRRLRLYAATDRLADQLAQRWAIDPASDHPYALRALVRVWREREYDDDGSQGKQSVNAFLDQFDFDYRVRRLGFLLRKVDEVTRLFREHTPGRAATAPAPASETGDWLGKTVARHFGGIDPTGDPQTRDLAIATLRVLKVGLLEARRLLVREQRELGARAQGPAPHDALAEQLREVLSLLIGESPDGSDGGTDPATRPRTVALDLVGGGSVTLDFDMPALRGASGLQTLQESVLYRAQVLLDAAAQAGETVLAAALLSGIESMRFKSTDPLAAPGAALAASNIARALLGEPYLRLSDAALPTDARPRIWVDVVAPRVPTGSAEGAQDLLESDVGTRLRRLFGEYYLRFDSFDQMSFPLYYDTGTGEPAAVEVIRISPVDATRLIDEAHDSQQRRKLAGTALAHFGAFLDARWRRNDVMWGRLDGAERLITALLPGDDADTRAVRADLIDRAHGRILRSALTRAGQLDLTALLCEALDEVGGEPTEARLRALVGQLGLGTSTERDRLAGILIALLSEAGLIDYVRHTRKNDPEPEPKAALRNLSRAVTVAGRLLDDIGTRRDLKTPVARWVARAGLVMQGIVAVSLPGTLNQRWFAYAVNVLYAFEVVALAFALLFGSSGARSLAATALLVTIAVHFLSLVAGDVMREKGPWRRFGVYGAIAIALLLAGLGGVGLYQVGMVAQLCGPQPRTTGAGSGPWLCERLGW